MSAQIQQGAVTRAEVEESLANLIADAMYMDVGEIGQDQLFINFGLESVTLMKIVARIGEIYGREITIREVLPHQTLREATDFIYAKFAA